MNKIDEIISGMKGAYLPSDYWISPNIEFPEIYTSRLIMQRNGQSVWDHTMSVIDVLDIKNTITLLSGLFHDLGKGYVLQVKGVSLSRFPGHADQSAVIAKTRLFEWGASPYIVDRVIRIISTHMFDISNVVREKTVRKFVADVGIDNIDNWFILRVADSRSYARQQRYRNHFIEPFRKSVMSYLSKQPSLGQPTFGRSSENGSMQIKGEDS